MKNFAVILIACGAAFIALSLILLGYVDRSTTEYTMYLADIVLGFIMSAAGTVYLIVKKNIMK